MSQRMANDRLITCWPWPCLGYRAEGALDGKTLPEAGDVISVTADTPRCLTRAEDAQLYLLDQILHLAQR